MLLPGRDQANGGQDALGEAALLDAGRPQSQRLARLAAEGHADNPTVANFAEANFNTGVQVYDTTRSVPDIQVGEPFGADHVIAVTGRRPLTRLMAALKASNAQLATTDVVNALATEKTAEGQTVKIGLRGIYTARS